jgi:two-component system invasion response regulator UvrY
MKHCQLLKVNKPIMQPIKIFIVDDHTLLREALKMTLASHPHFSIVGEAGDGEKAVELVPRLRPDVITMDINLPGISGIEATKQIRRMLPGAKVLGISLHTQPSYACKMMQAGAYGYVTKNSGKNEMFKAITEVYEGRKYVCAEIKNILSSHISGNDEEKNKIESLSLREIEIIKHIKDGSSSKEIAQALFISVKTIEVHRYNILKKLKLKNAAALVNFINKHPELEM